MALKNIYKQISKEVYEEINKNILEEIEYRKSNDIFFNFSIKEIIPAESLLDGLIIFNEKNLEVQYSNFENKYDIIYFNKNLQNRREYIVENIESFDELFIELSKIDKKIRRIEKYLLSLKDNNKIKI